MSQKVGISLLGECILPDTALYLYILADFVGCTLFNIAWRWLPKTQGNDSIQEHGSQSRVMLIALPVNTACHVTGLLLTSLLHIDSTRARTLASRLVTLKFSARHAIHVHERLILPEAINLRRGRDKPHSWSVVLPLMRFASKGNSLRREIHLLVSVNFWHAASLLPLHQQTALRL